MFRQTSTPLLSLFALAALAALSALSAVAALPAAAHASKPERGADAHGGRHARAAQATPCPDADLLPAAGNLAAVRAAVLCLHNRIRAERGLPLLRENTRLRRAAVGHSTDMVARGYFEHTAPGGVSFVDRILAANYARQDQGWSLGENLAWGTNSLSTPSGVVEAWMDSPGHRANILRRAYREIGLGIALGVPSDSSSGATFTADFGVRR